MTHVLLRQLPSIDRLLATPAGERLIVAYGHDAALDACREAQAAARARLLAGETVAIDPATLLDNAATRLADQAAPTLQPVINATGVIIHTNLGRAPLCLGAIEAMTAIAAGYSTLEYDIDSGGRGSRSVHATGLLRQITGAEASHVVNNNASAVLLMLTALCQGREVIISRGQLVEIGGGFRIPDVMGQSGARLVEVGTTNRTHLRDYAAAINENTAAIMVAHHSNYKIIGFTTEPSLAELAELARAHGVLLLHDQGSGALLDTAQFGLDPEPLVGDSLADGADVVAFSGDKLLGGPQAGILCGRADAIHRIQKHPLARAVRADKLCLAGLTATLAHYRRGDAVSAIPVWQMMGRTLDELVAIANAWAASCRAAGLRASVRPGESTIGGGSLPGQTLPTQLLALNVDRPDEAAARLRLAPMPVIGRIQDDKLLFDPRTVLPDQSESMLATIISLLAPDQKGGGV